MTNKLVKMDFSVMTSCASLHVQSFLFCFVSFTRFIFFHTFAKGVFFSIKSVLAYFEWFGVLNTPKAY